MSVSDDIIARASELYAKLNAQGASIPPRLIELVTAGKTEYDLSDPLAGSTSEMSYQSEPTPTKHLSKAQKQPLGELNMNLGNFILPNVNQAEIPVYEGQKARYKELTKGKSGRLEKAHLNELPRESREGELERVKSFKPSKQVNLRDIHEIRVRKIPTLGYSRLNKVHVTRADRVKLDKATSYTDKSIPNLRDLNTIKIRVAKYQVDSLTHLVSRKWKASPHARELNLGNFEPTKGINLTRVIRAKNARNTISHVDFDLRRAKISLTQSYLANRSEPLAVDWVDFDRWLTGIRRSVTHVKMITINQVRMGKVPTPSNEILDELLMSFKGIAMRASITKTLDRMTDKQRQAFEEHTGGLDELVHRLVDGLLNSYHYGHSYDMNPTDQEYIDAFRADLRAINNALHDLVLNIKKEIEGMWQAYHNVKIKRVEERESTLGGFLNPEQVKNLRNADMGYMDPNF